MSCAVCPWEACAGEGDEGAAWAVGGLDASVVGADALATAAIGAAMRAVSVAVASVWGVKARRHHGGCGGAGELFAERTATLSLRVRRRLFTSRWHVRTNKLPLQVDDGTTASNAPAENSPACIYALRTLVRNIGFAARKELIVLECMEL